MNFLQKVRVKRTKKEGFIFIEDNQGASVIFSDGSCCYFYYDDIEIIKPTIKEIAQMLKAKGYCMDEGLTYIFFEEKPIIDCDQWIHDGNVMIVRDEYVDCSELENVDWKDSLRKVG